MHAKKLQTMYEQNEESDILYKIFKNVLFITNNKLISNHHV